jgi:aspartate/methionine/tyrosine aminotransferase
MGFRRQVYAQALAALDAAGRATQDTRETSGADSGLESVREAVARIAEARNVFTEVQLVGSLAVVQSSQEALFSLEDALRDRSRNGDLGPDPNFYSFLESRDKLIRAMRTDLGGVEPTRRVGESV